MQQALARLAEERLDFMLLDERMPGLSGLEVLAALRERPHAAPETVLLTAYGDDPRCLSALREGARNVLAKPIRVVDLARVLADCVGR